MEGLSEEEKRRQGKPKRIVDSRLCFDRMWNGRKGIFYQQHLTNDERSHIWLRAKYELLL